VLCSGRRERMPNRTMAAAAGSSTPLGHAKHADGLPLVPSG
jgi:hypothetical protein